MDRLKDKVILVTGAGSGIGYATADLFRREGARVVAAVRKAADLPLWEHTGGVAPVVMDVTRREDIEAALDWIQDTYARLDGVCNIAGINDRHFTLDDTDEALWDRIMDTDLKGPFRILKRAVPMMLRSGGGSIVNIGSYAALRGNHGPSYTAAKAGLAGLTKSIAFGYGPQGIRCNIVHPGAVDTDINLHSGGEAHPVGMARLRKIADAYPSGWSAKAEEIAAVCLFLCSDEARHVNGAELSVDGGACCC